MYICMQGLSCFVFAFLRSAKIEYCGSVRIMLQVILCHCPCIAMDVKFLVVCWQQEIASSYDVVDGPNDEGGIAHGSGRLIAKKFSMFSFCCQARCSLGRVSLWMPFHRLIQTRRSVSVGFRRKCCVRSRLLAMRMAAQTRLDHS